MIMRARKIETNPLPIPGNPEREWNMTDPSAMYPGELLLAVEKPSRYTGGEVNAVRKDPGTCRLRFALAFPDTYEVGMSHLGLQILYAVLNGLPEVACERCYAPWPDMEAGAAPPPAAPLLPGVAAAARRLRHRRLFAPVRTLLHERSDDARSGRDSAPPRGAGRRAPADHRRRPFRLQPRSDERLHRRLRHRRGGGGRRGRSPPPSWPSGRGAARGGNSSRPWPQSAGSTFRPSIPAMKGSENGSSPIWTPGASPSAPSSR